MASLRYTPPNLARWIIWGSTALVFLLLPVFFPKPGTITLLTQMGIMIIFALSYNMILGQSGMLSFGHAVYSGLGAYIAIHALALMGKGSLPVSVTFLPLIGGLAGAFFGIVFGYISTKRSGTTFAMISLGIGELVFACSLMFPGFFGGEGGINANRVIGQAFLGIDFKSSLQVYYLTAVWCFVAMVAMFALTQTPLGRMANAVRDNPERAEFVGYDTQKVRWIMLILSGFFAGIAGGLGALELERVTAENVAAVRSGGVLLAAFLGGVGFFFGPIIGAVIFMFFVVELSNFTKAWLLYLGAVFVLMVMYAPGGVSSLIMMQFPILKVGRMKAMLKPYLLAFLAATLLCLGLILLIELTYHFSLERASGDIASVFGIKMNVTQVGPWLAALAAVAVGGVWFNQARKVVSQAWGEAMTLYVQQSEGGAK
jgi:branched-chain amino acid transport system permease protein